ncbi:S-layer homology domain-containing protein [Candidatus Microthrix parvicella]|uniref:S-layer homology domain-containing protein n=1 Tax=Candidatus Neomicrothrix parvicella TaxID=41950 RepID=UPI00037FF00B|nr:S-layer homology domain-containing protein [Candidatus Microthrix parvicella]
MSDGLSRIWMSMALLVSIAAFGLGVPAGAAPAAPGAPAAPAASRVVSDASCSAPAPHGFSDVPTSHWANTAIAWLVEAKITGGTGPGKYSPNAGVTRAQMAQFLWANADKPAPTASHGFTDVTASHWANTAIAWLVTAGITGGTGPGKYSPNAGVTRAQMAQFLWTNADKPAPTASHGFTDVPTSHWANTAIAWLVEAEITGGTGPGKYSPNARVTRAQMAQFLWANACAPSSPTPKLSMDAGNEHTCAVKPNRTAKCWGYNHYGQLGDGTKTGRNTPTPVIALRNVTEITTGGNHTCALSTNGTVKCWGTARLENVNGTDRNTPTPVAGLRNVTAITAGGNHTCALTTNGTVKCWGYNTYGQLGDDTTTDRLTPTPVAGLTNVTSITGAGASLEGHTCATLTNNTVKCWGNNSKGQLGDGTTTNRLTPTTVTGLTNVATISAGARHTCATLTNNTAKCWGSNLYSQLGSPKSGDTSMRTSPTQVTGLTNATTIAAGNDHTCATINNGSAQCWGWNPYGQLGDGTEYTERTTPKPVTGLIDVTTITAGGLYTCATITNNTAKCWGSNVEGQLGDGTTTKRLTPTPVTGL